MSNGSVTVTIPANSQGAITCVSAASSLQKVTLTWESNSVVFLGTGQGQPMQADGNPVYMLQSNVNEYQILVSCEYSDSGNNGPFEASDMAAPTSRSEGLFAVYEASSTDSNNSQNGCSLTIAIASDALNSSPSDKRTLNLQIDSAGQLELHAKSYYNNPNWNGGDEHYITISKFDGMFGDARYSSTGWKLKEQGCWNQATLFGGYLYILISADNCSHQGMSGAVLTFNTCISYWGSMPTGYKSVNWVAEMSGSQYHLTRFTN